MPRAHPWSPVDDGIVRGRLLRVSHTCDVCEVRTACIEVDSTEGYKLPQDVPWTATIINLKDLHYPVAIFLGIGCGCYARFHRQVAHIVDSVEEGRGFPQT